MKGKQLSNIEEGLLLEAIFQRHGYDFRHYARASLKRRLAHCLEQSGLPRLSELIPKILYDEEFFNGILKDLSITVTEMFRDPPPRAMPVIADIAPCPSL